MSASQRPDERALATSAAEPRWYYDLHPTIRDLLAQHGDVPLLAVRNLIDSRPARPSSSAFEVELIRDGDVRPWVEVDFIVIKDGELVVGEAKSNDNFASGHKSLRAAAAKLSDAALAMGADRVVLATSAPNWREAAEAVVTASLLERATALRLPLPRVEVLTGVGNE